MTTRGAATPAPTGVPFYWKPSCHTCRQARRELEDAGVALQPIDILAAPPTVETLRALIARYGARAMVRRHSVDYPRLGIGRQRPTEDELAGLLHDHPDVAARPIVMTAGGPLLARDPALRDAPGVLSRQLAHAGDARLSPHPGGRRDRALPRGDAGRTL